MAGSGEHDETPDGCGDVNTMVYKLLRRVRDRRDDVEYALQGRSLRIQVMLLTSSRTTVYRIVLTTTGHVAILTSENLAGETFVPHVVLAGTPSELWSVLTGASIAQAVERGLLLFWADPEHVERVKTLVAAELRELAGGPATR